MTSGARAAALIAAFMVAVAACGGGSSDDDGAEEAEPVATTTSTVAQSPSTEGVVACDIIGVAILDPFYEKCLIHEGSLVAAAGVVPDAALEETLRLVEGMTEKRPEVRAALSDAGIFTAVLGANQQTTDIPEYAQLADDPDVDWNARARGFGSVDSKPPLVAEEDILCYETDLWNEESVAVHEFGHSFFDQGILKGDDGAHYQEQLTNAYNAAMAAGLWKDTYAAENESEYWATGVQLYYGANDRWDVKDREQLAAYDPALAELVGELLPADWSYACP